MSSFNIFSKPKISKPLLNHNRGFTLAEVLAASAVLIIAAYLFSVSLITPLKIQTDSEKAFQAVFLAQRKAEELKGVPWSQLTSQSESEIADYPEFRCSVEIKNLNTYTKQITVYIYYTTNSGKTNVQKVVFERTGGIN